MNQGVKNAVSYPRVSSPKQSQWGDSLAEQLKLVKKLCQDEGWNLMKDFPESHTATGVYRPALEEAIQYIIEKKKMGIQIHYFIISKIDRITRWEVDIYFDIKNRLKDLWVEIRDTEGVIQESRLTVSVEGVSMDYKWARSSPSTSAEILGAHSAWEERKNILKRTIAQQMRNSLAGFWVWEPTYWFITKKVVINDKKKTIQLPDAIESVFVLKWFDMLDEGYSEEEIVNEINAMGFRSRIKNKWDSSHTKRIGDRGGKLLDIEQLRIYAKNPIYAGVAIVKWGRPAQKFVVLQQYPGLISIEKWNRINKWKRKIIIEDGKAIILEKDQLVEKVEVKRRLRNNPLYPFGKLVLADSDMVYFNGNCPRWGGKKRGRYGYYTARPKNQKSLNIPEIDFEGNIIECFKMVQPDKKIVELYLYLLESVWKERKQELGDGKLKKMEYLESLKQKEKLVIEQACKFADSPALLAVKEKELIEVHNEQKLVQENINNDLECSIDWEVLKSYWKKLIENLGIIASISRNHKTLKLLFTLVFMKVPTYSEIVNRTVPLQPFFSLVSQQKIPEVGIWDKNLFWQGGSESNWDQGLWRSLY